MVFEFYLVIMNFNKKGNFIKQNVKAKCRKNGIKCEG